RGFGVRSRRMGRVAEATLGLRARDERDDTLTLVEGFEIRDGFRRRARAHERPVAREPLEDRRLFGGHQLVVGNGVRCDTLDYTGSTSDVLHDLSTQRTAAASAAARLRFLSSISHVMFPIEATTSMAYCR